MEYYAYLQADILGLQGQEEHTGVSGPKQNPFKATESSPSALVWGLFPLPTPTCGEHRVQEQCVNSRACFFGSRLSVDSPHWAALRRYSCFVT